MTQIVFCGQRNNHAVNKNCQALCEALHVFAPFPPTVSRPSYVVRTNKECRAVFLICCKACDRLRVRLVEAQHPVNLASQLRERRSPLLYVNFLAGRHISVHVSAALLHSQEAFLRTLAVVLPQHSTSPMC